jgi:hypothetical protein
MTTPDQPTGRTRGTTIRFDPDIRAWLDKHCKTDDRSLNKMVNKLLTEAIETRRTKTTDT